MAADLADSLWLKICQYLLPCERFQLCPCNTHFNGLLCRENYPVLPFYEPDLNYWVEHIQCYIRREDETYAINLHALWNSDCSLNPQIIQCIKYFIIFYHKISSLNLHRRIERQCQYRIRGDHDDVHPNSNSNGIAMLRLSDDEGTEEDEEEEVTKHAFGGIRNVENLPFYHLVAVDIDLNSKEERDFIPSSIESLYLHEISNRKGTTTNALIHWISNIFTLCDSQCSALKDVYFDQSHLHNQHIEMLCDALNGRSRPLMTLQHLSFAYNMMDGECIGRLLMVLNEQCPGLKSLNLGAGVLDNEACRGIEQFYKGYFEEKDSVPLDKMEDLDLSNNVRINNDGVDCINHIFELFEEKGKTLTMTVRVAGCRLTDFDPMWSANIDPYPDNEMF